MKKTSKLLALVMAFAMVLGLTACGGSTTSTGSVSNTTSTSAATAQGSAAATSDKVYHVGICQLVQHNALDAATKGFKAALTKKLGNKVVFDLENAAGDSPTCATICNQFVSSKVDLIMANATAALQAATAATDTIPILGTSVTDYGTALDISNWKGTTGKNISGTTDLAPLDKQADMIKQLFPNAKKVGILYCSAEANSKYQSTEITKLLTNMGYSCKEYTFADTNDVASVTSNACDNSDVIYIPTDNTAANCVETINNVASPKKIPIVAGEEGICKGCGVATLSISYYDLGYKTGEMAYDVLVNGADISTMKVKSAPKTTYEYVASRCKTLGITVPDNYQAIKADTK